MNGLTAHFAHLVAPAVPRVPAIVRIVGEDFDGAYDDVPVNAIAAA